MWQLASFCATLQAHKHTRRATRVLVGRLKLPDTTKGQGSRSPAPIWAPRNMICSSYLPGKWWNRWSINRTMHMQWWKLCTSGQGGHQGSLGCPGEHPNVHCRCHWQPSATVWFIKKLQKRTQKNIEICVQKGVGFPKQNSDFLECPKANLNKSTGKLSIVLSLIVFFFSRKKLCYMWHEKNTQICQQFVLWIVKLNLEYFSNVPQ